MSIFSATFWLLLLRWFSRGLGIIRTIVLAAVLSPEEYGIGVFALTIVLFLESASQVSGNYLLIRTSETAKEFYDAAWTLEVLRGAGIAAIIVFGAGAISHFFEEDRLSDLLYLLGASMFIGSLSNIGMAEFMRDLSFSQNFVLGAGSRVIGFLCSVTVAVIYQTYWAIAVGYSVQQVSRLVISYRMHPYRPRLRLSGIGTHFEHSKWLLAQSVLFQVILRADIIVIGKILGPIALAPYHIAKMVTELFGAEIATAVKSSLFPAFSHRNEGNVSVSQFVSAQLSVVCIGAPLCIFLGAFSEDIVILFLTDKWHSVAPLVTILVWSAIGTLVASAPGALLLARGLTRLVALRQLLGVLVFVPGLLLFIGPYGSVGAAAVVSVTSWISAFAVTYFALREIEGTWRDVILPSMRLTLLLVLFLFVLLGLDAMLPEVKAQGMSPLLFIRLGCLFFLSMLSLLPMGYILWLRSNRPASYEVKIWGLVAVVRKLVQSKR